MEQRPIFRDRQEVTPGDLNNLGMFAQEAHDHIVQDGIEAGRRFVGFAVTQSTATSVKVAAGRLYYDGKIYFRDEPGGLVVDLNALKPNLQKKIVAIVAWPADIETNEQQRFILTDPDTLDYEATPVLTEARRQARLEAVGGAEAVSPQAPVIDASAVVVALIEMDPAGISTIARGDAELRNLGDVADQVEDLTRANAEIEPQVATIKSDLARIASQIEEGGNKEILLSTTADVALIKARLDIPSTYVGYRGSTFTDPAADVDDAFAGYAARVEEGLRFPYAAQAEAALDLLNPNAPGVVKTATGLLLPQYTEVERRITKGLNGTLSLAEYSNLENRTMTRLEMSRERVRFGADFEVTVGGSYWAGGTYHDRLNGIMRNVFVKNGETFQVYETGRVDSEGHKIVRLSKYWTDSINRPYWSRLTTEENLLGYAHVETFLNPQDAIVTALGPHMMAKPANGQLTIGICETDRGQPDLSRILTMVTLNANQVQTIAETVNTGTPPKHAIPPTFLEGGKRYGYFLVTQHAFQIGVADAQNASSQGATGTYFYGMNGGTWFAEPSVHLIWRDWRAAFPKASVDVDLAPLQLAGGIQGIDILTDAIVPGSTDLVWSVQIGGFWRKLSEADPEMLAALNALLPLRATFLGTPDIMPMFRLTGSRARVSRMAKVMKGITKSKALGTNANTIVQIWRLRGFDPAHHTFTPTVRKADGTIETADTVTTVTQADGVIEKRATFNLTGATNAFRSILDGVTDSEFRPWSVAELVEIAT